MEYYTALAQDPARGLAPAQPRRVRGDPHQEAGEGEAGAGARREAQQEAGARVDGVSGKD